MNVTWKKSPKHTLRKMLFLNISKESQEKTGGVGCNFI